MIRLVYKIQPRPSPRQENLMVSSLACISIYIPPYHLFFYHLHSYFSRGAMFYITCILFTSRSSQVTSAVPSAVILISTAHVFFSECWIAQSRRRLNGIRRGSHLLQGDHVRFTFPTLSSSRRDEIASWFMSVSESLQSSLGNYPVSWSLS